MRTLSAKTRRRVVVGALALAAASCGGTSASPVTDTADQSTAVGAATTAPVDAATGEAVATEVPASPDVVEPAAAEPEASASPVDGVEAAPAIPATSAPTAVPPTAVPPTAVPPTAVPPTAVPAPTATTEPVAPAILVPELAGQFDTIAGGQIDLGSLQGQDVVLWFWAPW